MARYSSELEKDLRTRDFGAILARYRSVIEKGLAETHGKDSWFSKALREALQAGGKRLRPIITLLVCEAVSNTYEEAIHVAIAYELAHAASLVQDDIIDESSLRHSSPTAHKRYGVARAILLSDGLIFEIFAQLARYRDTKISKDRLAQLVAYVAQAAKLAAEGELTELSDSAEGRLGEDDYLRLAALKTGALFAAAAASGAIVAGGDEGMTRRMYEFGESFGIAFQIEDDIIDILGDTSTAGKPTLKDVQNNSSNIVINHALSKADPLQRHAVASLLYKNWFSAPEAERLRQTLKELGSLEYAYSLLERHTARSRELLEELPASEARETLLELTRTLEVRMD